LAVTAPARPALRYHGGKWRLAPWIIAHFPPHKVYVEPFGGGASVLLRKSPLAAECYNDLDATVVGVFRVLRDPAKARELQRRLALTPFARAEFDWSYEPAVDDIDGAHKMVVRSFMGHGSDSVTRGCRTGFRARLTDERALPSWSWANYADTIPFFTGRLLSVTIEQRDAGEIIARYDGPATLFYCDPPYRHGLRSALRGRSKRMHGYAHELDDADHVALLERLCGLEGMVALSGYPDASYDEALAGWQRVECSSMADGAQPRTEVLWLNPAATRRDLFSRGRSFEFESEAFV
jgi:DNA adenine methylase